VSGVFVDIDNFTFAFDGVNDFVYLLGGFLNKIVGIIVSKIKYIIINKIEQVIPLINRILDIIPNKIDIPGTALHIDIGFANNLTCKNDSYLELPLSVSLQSDIYPYTEQNLAVFPNFTDSGFEIEAAIS
jgi:hypothetical protein